MNGNELRNPPKLAGSERQNFQPSSLGVRQGWKVSLMRHQPASALEVVKGPPVASPFYLVLGKVSWAQAHLQLPPPWGGKPWGGSFLPRTSITPEELGTARRLLPEVSPQKGALFTPTQNEGVLERPKFFT